SGQTRASTVTVEAGSSERITVEVDPPDFTPAGTYPIKVRAAGGGHTAEVDLTVEITGTYEMTLITPDESLNVAVQAGKATEMPLVLVNGGSSPLNDVTLSATPPRGWEVTFSPETIGTIEPGQTAEVVATITPAGNAITGDYRITSRARVPQTEDEIEVRATVETSAYWGFVGVAIIVIALAARGMVFCRFGRSWRRRFQGATGRGQEADEDVRRPGGGERDQPVHRRRGGLRVARPQRRGQDHDHPHAPRPRRAHLGLGPCRWPRPDPRASRGEAPRGGHARRGRPPRGHDGTGEPPVHRPAQRGRGRASGGPDPDAARGSRPRRCGGQPRRHILARHAPAAGRRRRPGQGPAGRDPRRADRGHRPPGCGRH